MNVGENGAGKDWGLFGQDKGRPLARTLQIPLLRSNVPLSLQNIHSIV